MNYKAIFVDWDGTLSNSRFWDRWIGTERYQLIQRELFININARDMLNNWMCGWTPYDSVLKYLEEKTSIPYKELEDELRYSAEHMEYIDPKVTDLIFRLREKNIKVVVATDNMDTFKHWTIPALGLDSSFDGVLVSDSRGALKSHIYPDGTSMFFSHYLSQNMIKPEETVLIDNSEDAKIVETFGMNFLHVSEELPLSAHLDSLLRSIS